MVTVRGAHVEVLSLPPDAAEVAAVAFLTRYSGRTLDAYHQDLRGFFTWMAAHGVAVLEATRAHIELYRAWMEARGLAAATIDRRLSTVCGYRFAPIDGRIPANPATYVRRPKVPETIGHGMDRGELGAFLFTAERFDPMHAALAVLLGLNGLRVSEAYGADIEHLGVQRGHRTLAIVGKGNKSALIPLVPRTARTLDRAVGERFEGPILLRRDGQRLDRRTAHRWVGAIGRRAGLGAIHPHMLRAGFIMATLDAGPAARRAARGPSRRPPHHHHLRPATRELRPTRRLRRRRLRRRWVTTKRDEPDNRRSWRTGTHGTRSLGRWLFRGWRADGVHTDRNRRVSEAPLSPADGRQGEHR